MRLYLRCLKYLKPYNRHITFAIICMIFYAVTNTAIIAIMEPMIDKGILGTGEIELRMPLVNQIVQFNPLKFLGTLAVFIVALYFLRGLSYYGQSYLTTYAGSKAIIDLRDTFYEHVQSQPMRFFTERKTGDLLSRLLKDVDLIEDSLTVIFSDIIREPLTMIILLVFLFNLNWQLTLISVIGFPLSAYFLNKFGKKIKKLSYSKQKRIADVVSLMQEAIGGIETVKIFGKEKEEAEKLKQGQNRFFKFAMKKARAKALAPPVMELISSVGIAVIFYIGGRMVITGGNFTIGEFFAFLAGLSALYRPIKVLTKVNNSIQGSLGGAERVFEILDYPVQVCDAPDAVDLPPFGRKIVFHDVSFCYDHENILNNINLTVKKGEVVAIVGSSGVGKTTLINLIPRFYDPTEGKIEIDGYDLKKVRIKSLRKQLVIVAQEVFLFNDTVKNNIAYGCRDMLTDKKIVESAKAASAHRFIEKFAKGYDTMVGERGAQLSGGQRQRIAIARALLKNPAILILDEATSELDSESENIVQEALKTLMKGRTTFIIAHRLSTITHADKIVVLQRGRIIEVGAHEELLKKNGVYKKFYKMQHRPRKKR